MNIRRVALLCVVCVLAACKNYEGVFEPACTAYEGDRVELRDGNFEWQRFTDQRAVDENGEVVDPFPDFPKAGSYEILNERVSLSAEDGSKLGDRFLVERGGELYLLSAAQNTSVLSGQDIPRCALRRSNGGQ